MSIGQTWKNNHPYDEQGRALDDMKKISNTKNDSNYQALQVVVYNCKYKLHTSINKEKTKYLANKHDIFPTFPTTFTLTLKTHHICVVLMSTGFKDYHSIHFR